MIWRGGLIVALWETHTRRRALLCLGEQFVCWTCGDMLVLRCVPAEGRGGAPPSLGWINFVALNGAQNATMILSAHC